jgi:hypothetical protein
VCHFCHAQPFEIKHAENIKSPLLQHSCRNAEVAEAVCDAGCRLSNRGRPSIHQPPVDALPLPAEMPATLSLVTQHAGTPVSSCWRRAYHRERRQQAILIELAALPAPNFPRLRALALFGRRPPQRVVRPSCRRPKTCTEPAQSTEADMGWEKACKGERQHKCRRSSSWRSFGMTSTR